MTKSDIIEKLAELEHEQWIYWAKNIMDRENMSDETINRWYKSMVPYSELSEDTKEHDRVWARKAYQIFMDDLIPKNMWEAKLYSTEEMDDENIK